MLPWFLLLGFLAILFALFGDRLATGTPVLVETVVTMRASAVAGEAASPASTADDPWESSMRFQASGWIEPEPLPLKVTSLVDGVIEEVLVLEGEAVRKGQVLARLVREDFELDLAGAQRALETARAEAEANEAAVRAVGARIATLEKEVAAGKLRLLELEDRRDRLAGVSGGGVSDEDIAQAKLRVQTHRGELEALAISRAELESGEARLLSMREAHRAKVGAAETEVARRSLALERTEVRAPMDGRVLRLFAVPGKKSMLGMDDMDSATIATLYQPERLQARIDVPLEEASGLFVGQAVRVRSNFLPDRPFLGRVVRLAGEADLQRNTLQVKVLLEDPDPRLRPEMLCRGEFLAPRDRRFPRSKRTKPPNRAGRRDGSSSTCPWRRSSHGTERARRSGRSTAPGRGSSPVASSSASRSARAISS